MKKVLAWAVVLALVLSSFTMAFAAEGAKTSKDFKDASQINYTEAVDVMVATGIINGYPDGTFGPAKTVKRSEMSKMIACIKNGGEDVGNQYKSACPFADSKDHWAAGYIAYCASEHIIDGRSADVFDPEAEVTGTEVAKMALTSLGYDSKIQGYTGETWAANVLKDAKKNNLFEGLDSSFVPGDPCNRESAAQILFNMLKATEVEYNGTISIDDNAVSVNSKAQPVAASGNEDTNDNGTLELYEDVFGGELQELLPAAGSPNGKDDYGRPGHAWEFEGEEVGTYSNDAACEFTAEDETTIEKAITAYDEEVAAEFYGADATKAVKNVYVNGVSSSPRSAKVYKGDAVELYDLGEKSSAGLDYYRAVVVQYEPYQITKVNTKVSKADAEKGVTAYITFDGQITVKDTELAGYDEETYVKDAIIAVAFGAQDKVLDSYVPEELVTGKVTKIKGDVYTIDGSEYEPSGVFYNFGDKTDELNVKSEYTVYDYNGYMFAAELVKAPAPEVFYGLVTATKSTEGGTADQEWNDGTDPEQIPPKSFVRILTPAGETEEYEIAVPETGDAVTAARTDLISYVKNEDGTITITDAVSEKALGSGDQGVKTGDVLYGKQLSEDVAAYANVGEAGKPDWKVYSLEDLKDAETITVNAWMDDGNGLIVLKVKSLEEAAKTEEVMYLVTGVVPVELEDGDAYDVTVLGESSPFTTRVLKTSGEEPLSVFGNFSIPQLMMLSFNKDDAIDSARYLSVKSVQDVSEKFGDNIDAVYYKDGAKKVLGKSDTFLNVGSETAIDNQVCSGADVYFISYENGKFTVEESDFDSIEEGNIVELLKVDESSDSWDTIFFYEDEE